MPVRSKMMEVISWEVTKVAVKVPEPRVWAKRMTTMTYRAPKRPPNQDHHGAPVHGERGTSQ